MFIVRKLRFTETIDIQVQEATQTQNEIGEIINEWVNVRMIKAEIQPLTVSVKRGIAGIAETSTHLLFTTDAIKSNQKLITPDGVFFIVQYVEKWTTYRKAVLELCRC